MLAKKRIKLEQITSPSAYSTQFLNPQQIIDQLNILPGMKIAHFGCGSGYFTFPMAERVGEAGCVWALDILEYKTDLVRSNAKARGLKNITVRRVNLESVGGSGLEDGSADWVVMVNVLYQNSDKSRIIEEANRVIKATGQILLIDWKDADSSFGPAMNTRINHEELLGNIESNGLRIAKELHMSELYFGMILKK